MSDEYEPKGLKGLLRKAMSGHLGVHRVTTVSKVMRANEIQRGDSGLDKYAKIAKKFQLLEHSVTLEDNHGDEDNENVLVERTLYETASKSFIVLTIFFGLGVISLYLLEDKMNFLDMIYFLVITLTTIGYGDISPSNKGSKLFVCLYTLFGLLLFSTALSGLLRYIYQQQEKKFRQEVLNRMNEEDNDLEQDDDDDSGKVDREEDKDSENSEEGKVHVEGELMENGFANSAAVSNTVSQVPTQTAHYDLKMIYDMTDLASKYFIEKLQIPPFAVPIIKDLLKSVLYLFLNICFGTLMYHFLQNEANSNFIDSLYLTLTTITTVGFGDVVPTTKSAKYFTIFYACIGTIFTANCILNFNQAITNYQKQHRQDIILRSEFSLKAFFDMDSDGNNEVTKEEFLLYKILHMNLVDPDVVARIERQFNSWDVDGSGTLTVADIEIMTRAKQGKERARMNLVNTSRKRGYSGGSSNSLTGSTNGSLRERRALNKAYSLDSGTDTKYRNLYSPVTTLSSTSLKTSPSNKVHPMLGVADESLTEDWEEENKVDVNMLKKSIGFSDVVSATSHKSKSKENAESGCDSANNQEIVRVFDES